MKMWAGLHTLLLVVLLFSGCSKPRQQLNLLVWSDYVDPQIILEFERLFDCRVVIDLFEDYDIMLAKMAAGGDAAYDVVATGNLVLPSLIKRKLIAPLRQQHVPNLQHIDAQFSNPPFDPGNRYGAPCTWGAAGLFVRRSPSFSLDESWGLIFDPTKQPGPFLLVEDSRFCMGAAQWYRGRSANSTNLSDLEEARALLSEAKRRSLGFEGWMGCKNRVLAKSAVMAMASNSDAARGMAEDPDTYFFVPKEGSLKFLLTFSVGGKSPHRDLAETFINFMLEPRVAARFSVFNQGATPNQGAMQFIPASDRTNAVLYLPLDVMNRLEFTHDLGEAQRLYDEVWTQIKSW